MKKEGKVITILITLIVGVTLFLANLTDKLYIEADTFYQVYLKGAKLGVIEDEAKLYELIDSNQSAIKKQYNVDNVYPPTDLKIIATQSYTAVKDEESAIYDKIESLDDFTIKGYIVTINNGEKEYKINVLDKNVFYEAAKRFVSAFLSEDEYEKYINNDQEEIVETGRIIQNMKFVENISIKEGFISVNEKVYIDELDLTYFLLFGENPETKSYTIKLGDTIESISEDNQLNVDEFLIANSNYKTKDAVLRVGDKVNVTLIEPQLTFVYDLYEIKDETVFFDKVIKNDKTKPTSYKEVTQAGQNGTERYEEIYSVTNGERSQEAQVTKIATIKEVVDQVTTVGTRNDNPYIPQNPVVLDGFWAWPTNRGYVITSHRGWRWGKMHQGTDISGAGNFGSPIYAAAAGVVTFSNRSCPSRGTGYGDPCGGGMGNMVIIDHQNGYVTKYSHLAQNVTVGVGAYVTKGQVIGSMGNSGSSTGVHLHYEVLLNGVNIDPISLYR